MYLDHLYNILRIVGKKVEHGWRFYNIPYVIICMSHTKVLKYTKVLSRSIC